MMDSRLRVIQDEALDGPTNMARDEALLNLVGAGESPPTLRTYQWSPPTVSLGYFQRYADYAALPPPAGSLAVVRRLTGGGAILHDLELTYSLTMPLGQLSALPKSAGVNPAARSSFIAPLGQPIAACGVERLYELVHDALLDCLTRRGIAARRCGVTDRSGVAGGPFFCFARRHALDVLIGADKLAGSAQRRTRSAVLQHGSIILEARHPQQPSAALAGVRIGTLRTEFARAVAERAGLAAVAGDWSEAERTESARLTGKYAGDDWTRRR